MCDCRQSVVLYRGSDGCDYECQTDTYRCGPVAVRNAFRRLICCEPGPATIRRICAVCDAQPVHTNGFGGTQPEAMTAAISLFWPKPVHGVGATDCAALLRTPEHNTFIVLYSGLKPSGRRFYHYVFVWRERRRFFVQNEIDKEEYVVWDSQLESEYLIERIHCGVQVPQVWAVK